MTDDRTPLLERRRVRADGKPEPARRSADETMMRWGALFFFALGLYAVVFVLLGVLLSP